MPCTPRIVMRTTPALRGNVDSASISTSHPYALSLLLTIKPWPLFDTTSSSLSPVSLAHSLPSLRRPASTASPCTRACTLNTLPRAKPRYAKPRLLSARVSPPPFSSEKSCPRPHRRRTVPRPRILICSLYVPSPSTPARVLTSHPRHPTQTRPIHHRH